jgi:hypothetical protein
MKCECGNNIDTSDLGDDAVFCEWCLYPECPIYTVHEIGGSVILRFLNLGEDSFVLDSKNVSVFAPNAELAQMIFDDYMNNLSEIEGA